MNSSDADLLRRYSEQQSEAAFTELARRHFDLVYCAAARQVAGDAELARDVAQTVFADLARKARSLTDRVSLAGWLYTSTHFAAAKAVRGEQRRRAREQESVAMQEITSDPAANWEQLRPTLDRAMQQLDDEDREAVLLRYFEQRELRVVGDALGVSEDAARKRVDRALEKLRAILQRQGLTSTAVSLAAALSGQAVTPAPVGLAAGVAQAALSSLAASSSLPAFLHTMTMTKSQLITLSALALAAVTVPLYWQHHTIERLRAENDLARELAAAALEQTQRPALTPADAAELQRLRREHDELLRLRGEVSRLRQQLADASVKRPAAAPPPAPPKEDAQPPEPVQIFVANADATVPAGQTLALGGWTTSPGKRTLVFVQPKILERSSPGQIGQVFLEGRFIEVPDEVLAKVSADLNLDVLEHLKATGKASSAQSLLTSEQAELVLRTLEKTAGVDVISAPRISTGDGRQAVMSMTQQQMVAGQEHTLGPSLDVEPRIAADGSSVNLTVSVRLKLASPAP